jgi:hypothetical protein
MAKQDNRRPKGDTGVAEIYTADKGNPPPDPDMGSVKGAKPVSPATPTKKAKGGYVRAADGMAQRGKTKGRIC